MSATISFTFPASASFSDVIKAIELHYDARSDIGDDAPDVGARDAAEVFIGQHTTEPVRNAAAVFTGQPQAATTQPVSTVVRDAEGFPWDDRIHSSNKQFTGKGVWTKRKGVNEATHNNVKLEMHRNGLVVLPQQQAATTAPHVIEDTTSPEHLEKVARLNWATEQTMIQLGQYPGPVENFEKMKAGQMVTVAPHESDWFDKYRNMVAQLFRDNAPVQQAVYTPPAQQPTAYAPPGNTGAQQQIPSGYVAPNGSATPAPQVIAHDPNTYPGFAVFVSTAMQQGRLTVEQINQTVAQAGITDGVGLSAMGKHVDMIPAVLALLEGFYGVRP